MSKSVKRLPIRRRRYSSAARRSKRKSIRVPRRGEYRDLPDYIRRGPETQVELAARLKITQPHLSRIAAGGDCSLSLAKLISHLINVPLDRIGPPLALVA